MAPPDRVEVMPKIKPRKSARHPDRPKLKFKPVRKAPNPRHKLTPAEIVARNIAKIEAKHGLTPARVNGMIAKEHGLLTNVCKALKVPRTTLIRYIERHEVCIDALNAARDAMGDKAEKKLFELIEAGDTRCILYYLTTVHRHRGYGQNVANAAENNGPGGPTFVETVNIIGIPSGTFLPKETPQKDSMLIEHEN